MPPEDSGSTPWPVGWYTVFAEDVNWDDEDEERRARPRPYSQRKSYRFRSVFSVSNMGRAKTILVVLALVEMDILSFVMRRTRFRSRTAGVESWRARSTSAQPESLRGFEVHWTSQSTQIEAGYKKMKTTYERYARVRSPN